MLSFLSKCVNTVFSLKYRTAKINSRWECPQILESLIIEPKCPCEVESFAAPVSCLFVSLPSPIIATFCVRWSGTTKTHTECHLSRWRSILTVATVVVDHLDCKNNLLGTFQRNKHHHNANYGGKATFGLPKYWSCALLSTKDSTHAHSR